jgi:hypothetical protein
MMFLRGQRCSGDLQRRSLAAGGGDKGGEARSKRDGDGGTVELTEGGGEWRGGAKTTRRRQSGWPARTRGRGQRGGGRRGARAVLAKEEERGKRKGRAASMTPFIDAAGGRGRRGGVRGGVCMEERDERRDGGPSAAVRSSPCPTGVGGPHMRGAALSRGGGVADPWAQGHSNGRRGLNRFKFKRIQTTSKPSKL